MDAIPRRRLAFSRRGLALLILGWAVTAAPARADEAAKEERGKLAKEAGELDAKAFRMYRGGDFAGAKNVVASLLVCIASAGPNDS